MCKRVKLQNNLKLLKLGKAQANTYVNMLVK